jgi:parallel beta-helix repeat protein
VNKFKMAPITGALLALFANVACATINQYYVDSSVSTSGTGTLSSPYRTISDVNTKVNPPLTGDTTSVYFKCGKTWPALTKDTPTTLQLKSGVNYSSYYATSTSSSAVPIYGGCSHTATDATRTPIFRSSLKLTGLSWKRLSTGSSIYYANISASMVSTYNNFTTISQLIDTTQSADLQRLQRARYPNIGAGNYLDAPNSRYLHAGAVTTVDANPNWSPTYSMQLDQTNSIPAASNMSGVQVFARTSNWFLSQYDVTSPTTASTGSTLSIKPTDPGHTYLGSPAGGYWLENQFWMLDKAGEWYYDSANKLLYVWRRDGSTPNLATTYYASVNNFGATAGLNGNVWNANSVSNNFSLKNIDIQDTALDGVAIMGKYDDASALTTFTIDGINVSHAGRYGITVRAAHGTTSATTASSIAIKNSSIQYSLDMGIDLGGFSEWNSATNTPTLWLASSQGVDVLNNSLQSIGMDRFALAAIRVGGSSRVTGNTIRNAASRGIFFQGADATTDVNTLISNNYIYNSCALIDDCGAIYTDESRNPGGPPIYNMNLVIQKNAIENVAGSATLDGIATPHMGGIGIYLDNSASGVTVSGNSVTGADWGILLNAGSNSSITDNTVDLARVTALSIGPTSNGESFGNTVSGNALISTGGTNVPAVMLGTNAAAIPSNMATFTGNVYGARTATPFWVSVPGLPTSKLNLTQWQAAGRDNSTVSKLFLDLPLIGYVPVSGTNLVANEGFNSATNNWLPLYGPDTESVTYLSASSECHNGTCVKISSVKAPPASGLNNMGFYSFTPDFTIQKGHTYMVTFEARSTEAGDNIEAVLSSRGTGAALSDWQRQVNIGTQWQRYAIPVLATKATGTYSDGRIDLNIHTNATVYLDTVRVIDVTPTTNPETSSLYVRVNKSKLAQTVACSAKVTTNCSLYKNMMTGLPVDYTQVFDPWAHMAVYLDSPDWQDVDGDGVPGKTDQCVNTAAGAGVNEKGCSIGQ